MKRILALAAAALFASTTAFAFHCPKDMKEIDDALAKNPKLTATQMKEVKDLRAKGEELHKAGFGPDTTIMLAAKRLRMLLLQTKGDLERELMSGCGTASAATERSTGWRGSTSSRTIRRGPMPWSARR